jgi:hypothetical protein
MFDQGDPIGHLIWINEAMEAWTAKGEFVGSYPTRRDAASALWAVRPQPRKRVEFTHEGTVWKTLKAR